MTLRVCRCPVPRPAVDPRRAGWCNACIGQLPELSDADLRDFYRHLREMLDTTGHGEAGEPLSVQAIQRHDAGKRRFNWRWLTTDGADEAQEEAADLANYSAYETFRIKRFVELGADESEAEAARIDFLTAAYHAALAHAALRTGQQKLREALED